MFSGGAIPPSFVCSDVSGSQTFAIRDAVQYSGKDTAGEFLDGRCILLK
jgi:hypothetical protein